MPGNHSGPPQWGCAYPLPGVILWCGLTTGEDLIEAAQLLRRQAELHGRQGAVQLVTSSRTDDGCGDRGPVKQPGQGQRAGLRPDLLSQVLVRLKLVPMLGEALRRAALESPDTGVLLLDHPTEQTALQR